MVDKNVAVGGGEKPTLTWCNFCIKAEVNTPLIKRYLLTGTKVIKTLFAQWSSPEPLVILHFYIMNGVWNVSRGSDRPTNGPVRTAAAPAYLHLAVVERVAEIMSVNDADADVTDGSHHPLHRHRGHGRVGGRPAQVAAPSRRLRRESDISRHCTRRNNPKLY